MTRRLATDLESPVEKLRERVPRCPMAAAGAAPGPEGGGSASLRVPSYTKGAVTKAGPGLAPTADPDVRVNLQSNTQFTPGPSRLRHPRAPQGRPRLRPPSSNTSAGAEP